jgi:hypothetical protein
MAGSSYQMGCALDIFGKIVRAGVKVVTLKPEREYTVDTIGDEVRPPWTASSNLAY